MDMARKDRFLNFLMSATKSLPNPAFNSIVMAISRLMNSTKFNLRKSENCEHLLLTLHSSFTPEAKFEDRIAKCFEMEGYSVTVSQVELESMLSLKVEDKNDFDELVRKLRIKDVLKDQAGNTKNIKAVIERKSLSMVLVVLHSRGGDDTLCSNFSIIGSSVKVYRVRNSKFIEVFFEKCGKLENYMEELRTCDADTIEQLKIIPTKGNALTDLSCHYTSDLHISVIPERNFTRIILLKEECRTITVDGEYALEKCQLLQNLCQKFINKECKLYVNPKSKEVTIIGKDIEMFQKYVNMIELQLQMFHCEEIKDMSQTLFNLLTQNEKMKDHFVSVLAENQLDSVILLEDSFNRPVVLGFNKIKTRNFIEWFGRIFAKESIKFDTLHNNKRTFEKLKKSLPSLELNRLVSVDMTNDEISVHGLVTDVIAIRNCIKRITSQIPERLELSSSTIRPILPSSLEFSATSISRNPVLHSSSSSSLSHGHLSRRSSQNIASSSFKICASASCLTQEMYPSSSSTRCNEASYQRSMQEKYFSRNYKHLNKLQSNPQILPCQSDLIIKSSSMSKNYRGRSSSQNRLNRQGKSRDEYVIF